MARDFDDTRSELEGVEYSISLQRPLFTCIRVCGHRVGHERRDVRQADVLVAKTSRSNEAADAGDIGGVGDSPCPGDVYKRASCAKMKHLGVNFNSMTYSECVLNVQALVVKDMVADAATTRPVMALIRGHSASEHTLEALARKQN